MLEANKSINLNDVINDADTKFIEADKDGNAIYDIRVKFPRFEVVRAKNIVQAKIDEVNSINLTEEQAKITVLDSLTKSIDEATKPIINEVTK